MVTLTPFDEGSRIGYDGLASHLVFLPERGVEVIVPLGNTSECFSFRREEVKEALSKLRRTGGGVREPSCLHSVTDRERVKEILKNRKLLPA